MLKASLSQTKHFAKKNNSDRVDKTLTSNGVIEIIRSLAIY